MSPRCSNTFSHRMRRKMPGRPARSGRLAERTIQNGNLEPTRTQNLEPRTQNRESNSEPYVIGLVRRRCRGSLSIPLEGDEDRADDETANSRHEQEYSGGLKHRDDVIDADVLCRRGLLDDVNNDGLLLEEEQHVFLQLTPLLDAQGELGQRAHTDARWPFGQIRLRILDPRSARDVEVSPRQISGEFLDEERCRNGTSGSPAGIREIGDLALEELLVIVKHGHRPASIASSLTGAANMFDPQLRRSEEAARGTAERND